MKSSRPRWMATSIILTTAVTVICLAVFGFMFVMATSDARDATVDQVFAQSLFGLPILEGFHLKGKFGVHMKPGAMVLIAIPLFTGILTSIPALKAFVHGVR